MIPLACVATEWWARLSALLVFIGFNLTFFPQFLVGYAGMPRRYHAYAPEFQVLNVLSTCTISGCIAGRVGGVYNPRPSTMKRLCIVALLVLAATGVASPAPTRAALDLIRGMNATNAGVDRHGHFWYWDSVDRSVTTVSPEGTRATIDLDADVYGIDADSRRGVLTLDHDGRSIRVTAFTGAVTAAFELPFRASNVCWMDGDQIAVAPALSGWIAEVWSSSKKSMVRSMGSVPEIEVPSAGAVMMRTTLLRYDAHRDQLVTLDAFRGELAVFDRAGKIVRHGQITHPTFGTTLLWLRDLDEHAKRTGQSQTPSLWSYTRMALSPDGTVWLGEKSDKPGAMTIAKILPDGTVTRETVSVSACPGNRFELWGNQIVFFRSSRATQRCVATKEIKP
jgi:hypothetical protein